MMTDSHALQGELATALPDASFEGDLSISATATVETVTVDQPSSDDHAAKPVTGPNPFATLGLSRELVAAVTDLGFTEPTTVQAKTIPLALPQAEGADEHIDLMVSSQTGSGKTAAFLLPLLHTLLQQRQAKVEAEAAEWAQKVAEAAAAGLPSPRRPKRKDPTHPRNFRPCEPGALVLCPTRELAQQVAHDAIDLVKHAKGLRIAHVVGGMPYAMQIARLQNADLVVATPGRLLDLQRSVQIKLEKVQFLVVDEADRMLDLGFADDLAEINQLTAQRRQTMMFSATFAPRIQQLAARVMRTPRRVQIDSPQERHTNIQQSLYWADNAAHKRRLLDHWLRDPKIEQAIVFASTQIECDGLAGDLQQAGFSAVALHGALSQGMRNRRLMALRNGQVQILVATDVAARGIDVPSISHVFNYGLPMKSEDYVHRIGRTGRAGRDGLAITFAEFRDRRKIVDIESYTHQRLNTAVVPGLEPTQRPQFDRKPQDRRGGPRRDGRTAGWGQDRHPQGRADGGHFNKGEGFRGEGFRGEGARNEGFRSEGFRHEGPRREGFKNEGPRREGFRNEGFKGDGFTRPQGKPAPRKGPVQVRSGKPAGPRGTFKPRAR